MSAGPEPDEAPDVAAVRTLLAAAGLPATEAEIARYAALLPAIRAGVALLHAAPAARWADPAVRFRADADGADWW